MGARRRIGLANRIDFIYGIFQEGTPYKVNASLLPVNLRSLFYEDMTDETCDEIVKWLDEKCIERILDRES